MDQVGERMELWEHSTFLVLCLVTYMLWQRADNYVKTKGSALVRESAGEVKSGRVGVRSGGQLILRRKISTRLQTLRLAEAGNTGKESPVVRWGVSPR